MSQEHVDAVRRSLDGWNRDDFEACVSIAHPEIEWVSELAQRIHGPKTVYQGIAGLRRYWDEWHELWDVRLDPTEFRDLGDTVLVLAMTRARGDASGVGFEQLMGYVYEFEDGMARRVRSYHDPDRALEAVGLAR
ncbi:MAG: nuclear transport factor 2 family protein [Thermoleophilaceae bacterium]